MLQCGSHLPDTHSHFDLLLIFYSVYVCNNLLLKCKCFLSRIYNKTLFSRTCICRDFKNMVPSYCRLSLMLSRNGVLNHILKRQTPRFHYGSKFPAVIITVLSQYLNKTGKTVVITAPTSQK